MIRARTFLVPVFAALGLVLLLTGPARAQDTVHDPGHLHTGLSGDYCGTDFSSDAARGHLAAYLKARQEGRLPVLRKGGSPPDIGTEQTFNVSEANGWIPLLFRAMDVTDKYVLWVEIAELDNGNVTPDEIAGLRTAIFDTTPAASINPASGFLPNIDAVFGQPPNVDGDGLVDILVYDIGRGPGNTLGYVSSADVNPAAPSGTGNGRDVLYLDSDRGTANLTTLAAIAAHEYTHLVHLSYGWDTTFLNEGYAEYAMVMNGHFWRGISFLGSRTEYTRTLFEWRDSGGPGAVDYQRAGLFVTYVADVVGPDGVAGMLQSRDMKGARGIDSVMTARGSSLGALLQDYHAAILYNDRSLDSAYGFTAGPRANLRVSLDGLEIDGEVPSTAGEGGYQTVSQNQSVSSGAVQYYRWKDVADFQLIYRTPGWQFFPAAFQAQQRETLHSRNRMRIVLQPADGSPLQFVDIAPGSDVNQFDGVFASVTAIASNLDPESTPGDQIAFEAFWTPRSRATSVEDASLPGAMRLGVFPNPVRGSGGSVQIDVPVAGAYRLEVFDMTGRRIGGTSFEGTAQEGRTEPLPVGNLAPGAYVVRLTGPLTATTAPFVVLP